MKATVKHPSTELLLDFATGELDVPARVLLAAHLSHCGECAENVAALRAPGGRFLKGLASGKFGKSDAAEPPPELWSRLERAIASEQAAASGQDQTTQLGGLPLPNSAWSELREILARPIQWSGGVAKGVEWSNVALDPHSGAALMAVRAGRRRAFPAHEHVSQELGIVLEGGYVDHVGDFTVGDFFAYDAGTRHRPRTEPDEGCVVLVRLQVPNRFLGWRGLLMR